MAIDYTTPLGQVRLDIPDTDEANFIFTDAQIDSKLTINSNDVNSTVAQFLRIIASNDLMLFRVAIRSDDGSIGNAADTAKVLLSRADKLEAGSVDIGFDLVGGETYVPRYWDWSNQCL